MGDFSVINLSNAIRTVHTNVVTVSIQDESNYSAFDQDNNDITLDTVAITAEVTRLETEYDNNQYQRDRQYAPTGDQLDMLWHSIDAGEFGDTAKQSEFYIANKAVKDANPKP